MSAAGRHGGLRPPERDSISPRRRSGGQDPHGDSRRRHRTVVTVRMGLVGAGGVGARHARTLTGFDDVDLVAICDPLATSAEVLAAEVDARHVPDLTGLLALGLDAVWLCVPPFAHGDLELSVVRAGLPFFVEKPLAADLSVAEHVAAAVSAAGLRPARGSPGRPVDPAGRARPALAGTAVRLVDARWWSTTPPPAWWSRRDRSGGQVVEQATHLLDLVRLLAGGAVEGGGASAPSSGGGRGGPPAGAARLRLAFRA